jgi:hypothetical protein
LRAFRVVYPRDKDPAQSASPVYISHQPRSSCVASSGVSDPPDFVPGVVVSPDSHQCVVHRHREHQVFLPHRAAVPAQRGRCCRTIIHPQVRMWDQYPDRENEREHSLVLNLIKAALQIGNPRTACPFRTLSLAKQCSNFACDSQFALRASSIVPNVQIAAL